jgi:hypothetical protein
MHMHVCALMILDPSTVPGGFWPTSRGRSQAGGDAAVGGYASLFTTRCCILMCEV